MSWFQVRVYATASQVENIEDTLLECGAVSVTLQDNADQPILEPELGTTPIWDKTEVIGLFTANQDSDILMQNITQSYHQKTQSELPAHKTEILEEKDWVRAWMDDYHPMPFGQRLWVCPSWREPPEPNAVNLLLDPGLAFGTGTHPTTALCLKFLDAEVNGEELIVDYGCGSGILGIAGLLLGAKNMVGIDIDPQALLATQDNAQRNQIDEKRYQVFLPKDAPKIEGDITVANILAGPLVALAPEIAAYTRSGGKLALSGLLAEQADEIMQCYSQWFELNPPAQLEEWVVITGTKR